MTIRLGLNTLKFLSLLPCVVLPISIYPYKESKEIKRLRIRSWFLAVSSIMKLTPKQLEMETWGASDPYSAKNLSCIWHKYQRGDVEPRGAKSNTDEGALVNLVEKKAPGTKKWLVHPMWRLLDRAPLEMSEIKLSYLGLDKKLKGEFVVQTSTSDALVFWRKEFSVDTALSLLLKNPDENTFACVLTIMREAEIVQSKDRFHASGQTALEMLKKLQSHPVLGHSVDRLKKIITESINRQ